MAFHVRGIEEGGGWGGDGGLATENIIKISKLKESYIRHGCSVVLLVYACAFAHYPHHINRRLI